MQRILEEICSLVWGGGLLALFLGVGIFCSIRLRFMQIKRLPRLLAATLGELRNGDALRTISTALGAAMGTGNLVGVAIGLRIGGAGSLVWMWVAALLGMGTIYFENLFGGRLGGTLGYLEKHSVILSRSFALFCVLSSLGMGNLVQSAAISSSAVELGLNSTVAGLLTALAVGVVLVGGATRLGGVAAAIIPPVSIIYTLAAIYTICINRDRLYESFCEILRGAIGFRAIGGGFCGAALSKAMRTGLQRGTFSSEAGLGSSAILHANGDASPEKRGEWGICEVFVDTLCCTLTGLVLLTSGFSELGSAFSTSLGAFGGKLPSLCCAAFGFATILSWSVCGERCASYLFGAKSVAIYRYIYIIAAFAGAKVGSEAVLVLADIFNGLMAYPNLIGLMLTLLTMKQNRPTALKTAHSVESKRSGAIVNQYWET